MFEMLRFFYAQNQKERKEECLMQTIAIVNQKGGVGKSTTAVNLGAGLVRQGKRVLLIDADSQANLTEMLGMRSSGSMTISLWIAARHSGC